MSYEEPQTAKTQSIQASDKCWSLPKYFPCDLAAAARPQRRDATLEVKLLLKAGLSWIF